MAGARFERLITGGTERQQRVANAEMLSITATRRLVGRRAGRSCGDCRKSGMRRIATGDKIDRVHAEFDGPGQ